MFWGFDIYYFVLIVPAMLFAMWAHMKVSGTFNRYSRQRTHNGMTGAEAADAVLRACGVSGVRIERVRGNLTDILTPRRASSACLNRFTIRLRSPQSASPPTKQGMPRPVCRGLWPHPPAQRHHPCDADWLFAFLAAAAHRPAVQL